MTVGRGDSPPGALGEVWGFVLQQHTRRSGRVLRRSPTRTPVAMHISQQQACFKAKFVLLARLRTLNLNETYTS